MATKVDPAIAQRLKQMSGAWKKAATSDEAQKDSGFPTYPDGRYRTLLDGAEIGVSQSSNRLQIVWSHTILEGEFIGKSKKVYEGLDDPDKLVYVLRSLRKFGLDIQQLDMAELPDALEYILRSRPECICTFKTPKGSDFQNVYVNEVTLTADPNATGNGAATSTPVNTEVSDNENVIAVGKDVVFTDDDGVDQTGVIKELDAGTGIAVVLFKGKKFSRDMDLLNVA